MTGTAPQFWVVRCNAIDARAAWPLALPLLAPAIARSSGLFEPEDVEALVTRPESGTEVGWSLWLIGEGEQLLGAWTTRVETFPREKILDTSFGGGRDMKRWFATALAENDKFAALAGCTRLRCGGRRGWPGYSVIGHILERKLAA